jgi:hypothetical protein
MIEMVTSLVDTAKPVDPDHRLASSCSRQIRTAELTCEERSAGTKIAYEAVHSVKLAISIQTSKEKRNDLPTGKSRILIDAVQIRLPSPEHELSPQFLLEEVNAVRLKDELVIESRQEAKRARHRGAK